MSAVGCGRRRRPICGDIGGEAAATQLIGELRRGRAVAVDDERRQVTLSRRDVVFHGFGRQRQPGCEGSDVALMLWPASAGDELFCSNGTHCVHAHWRVSCCAPHASPVCRVAQSRASIRIGGIQSRAIRYRTLHARGYRKQIRESRALRVRIRDRQSQRESSALGQEHRAPKTPRTIAPQKGVARATGGTPLMGFRRGNRSG